MDTVKQTKKLIELSCMVCGSTYLGEEPLMCCSGRDCGCMGLPVDPSICSKECYDKLKNRTHERP